MRIPLLDHGYLELVESWGSDERIIEAARMSTNKGFQGWGTPNAPGDEKLLGYLWTHKHHTPFEMAGVTIEVQAPIMVFREWVRHRTQSFNEMSGRYSVLPDLCYFPSDSRLRDGRQSTSNKQAAGGAAPFHDDEVRRMQALLGEAYGRARQNYNSLLAMGVGRELARLVLPVAQYSRMRASANLRNWLGFLTLRMDPAAQFEIREYANALGTVVASLFPRTWALFSEGR